MPPRPQGPLVELTFAEAEKHLLQKVDETKDDPKDALWELAQFYKVNRLHDQALERLRQLITLLPDPESKARCLFTMGQTMEQVQDYPAAIRYYKEAASLEPASTFTWYFIHNNLGYSLNSIGRFAEGETYCRRAIAIDANPPNGYKNLGIALEGQGQYADAARCYVRATQANALDPRAFQLLEKLLQEHPELEYDFRDALDLCRTAIAEAQRRFEQQRPVVYRGWRKQLLLLKMKAVAFIKRVFGKS